jgi:hypothetical protein
MFWTTRRIEAFKPPQVLGFWGQCPHIIPLEECHRRGVIGEPRRYAATPSTIGSQNTKDVPPYFALSAFFPTRFDIAGPYRVSPAAPPAFGPYTSSQSSRIFPSLPKGQDRRNPVKYAFNNKLFFFSDNLQI